MVYKILKTTALIAALTIAAAQSYAQDILVVNPEFKKTSPYEFNSEWHYLTSDMYLFNGTKFQTVLNGMYAALPKKRRAECPNPENILITATIDGTALGKLNYPIFNFNIKNTDGQMKTMTADSYEAIRIMDNLPLTSIGNGKIDCGINVEIITQANPNKIFDFVASQLKSISEFPTPLSAAKTLVGELGGLITSKTTKTEYKFSSTIRLYEENDFSKRVASVSVYSFVPSQKTQPMIDSSSISKYIDTYDNPQIDRNRLASLIKCPQYPYMVIVNYKSKYISEPVIGDQTTSETIEARLAKVKKAYENGLLSAEIYTQELKLIDYLGEFVNLKSSISNYILNNKNRITDDFKMLFLHIFNNYVTLRETMSSRVKEFGKNPLFKNEFLPTYQTIMTNAEGYLDTDNNLKSIKNIAQTINNYKSQSQPSTPEANEKALAVLHSITFPDETPTPGQFDDLKSLIQRLEQDQLAKVFDAKINKLKSMRPSTDATAFCEKLRNEVNSTYCRLCSETATSVINDYMQRQEAENKRLAEQKLEAAISNARDQILTSLQQEKVIRRHFEQDYADGMPDDVAYMKEDFDKLIQTRKKLQSAIKIDHADLNTTQLDLASEDIAYETKDLAKILEQLCRRMPELCNE